jgi:hypothetical protein
MVMKHTMFICLFFVFAAGINAQSFAQEAQGSIAGMGLRDLRAGKMHPSSIMKNHQTGSEKTALSQQWPVEIVANTPSLMMTGDFDSDNDTDVLIQTSDSLFWYENQLPAWIPHYIDTDLRNAGVGWVDVFDMDMDGDLDIFQSFGTNPGTIMWFENKMNGMQWSKHIVSNSVNSPANMPSSFGDIDGDNDIDMVVSSWGNGDILWFENIFGDTIWQEHLVSNIGSNAIWTNMVDMDGDNDLDIIGARYYTGNIVWYENQLPDSTWPLTAIAILPGTAVGESIDMDGDNDLDVVTHSNASNVLNWYKNPSWEATTITSGVSEIWMGPLGDIDKDGDLDVTFGGINDIGWCQNLGDAENWQRYIFDTVANGYPFPADLADINSDTYLDVTAYTFNFPNMTGDSRWYANPLALPGIIRVPEDYPTIQAGIDASSDGDTVLVADSTYYENIDFKGKAITVASYYILDGDTNHIANTVIDGSQPSNPDSGSVVYFVSGEDTNSVLSGFTITSGTGSPITPMFLSTARAGGGILCLNSSARITHNIIINNSVADPSTVEAHGGGICSSGDSSNFIIIEENVIKQNTVDADSFTVGAGIKIGTNARVINNFIMENINTTRDESYGGGIAALHFSPTWGSINVTGNTITNNQVVSSQGIGGTGGGLTIWWYPDITIKNNTITQNMSGGPTYCWGAGGLLGFVQGGSVEDNIISHNSAANGDLSGTFFLHECSGVKVQRNLFEQNSGYWGGGIRNDFGGVNIIADNRFIENDADFGGGIWLYDSSPIIQNNLIIGNTSNSGGGIGFLTPSLGINPKADELTSDPSGAITIKTLTRFAAQNYKHNSPSELIAKPTIINNTIASNSASNRGGSIYSSNSQGVVLNSILYGNEAPNGPEIYLNGSTITVRYSDIQVGWPGEGNINVNPFFANTVDYQLSDSSLCIGAGIDSIQISGVWYHSPPTDMGGNPRPNPTGTMPDLGAWESVSGPVGIETDDFGGIPISYSLDHNYPNPFNPSTTIEFGLPIAAEVKLTIYNALGQQITNLFQGKLNAGKHRYTWQASALPSGLYFYRLSSKGFIQTRKMLLLK